MVGLLNRLGDVSDAVRATETAELFKWPDFGVYDIAGRVSLEALGVELLFGRCSGGVNTQVLTWDDYDFMTLRVLQDPFIYLYELQHCMEIDLGLFVEISTLCRALQRLGLNRKVASRIAAKRFSSSNFSIRIRVLQIGCCSGTSLGWLRMKSFDATHGDSRTLRLLSQHI
eukprot:TRINITY_DN7637_c0_g1_i1.p1 TRINITY_DN7637_c0_g1~~TRINITY_DN7637_c0_g1_i1.p1  ORF type:complete len:183 (-),score=8.72 TRINITY_DN7637_c0_g1_i1:318-830(-)